MCVSFSKTVVKGQLILKVLFGVFNSPKKKRTKTIRLKYHSSKVEFFCSFFGRIEDTKKDISKLTDL